MERCGLWEVDHLINFVLVNLHDTFACHGLLLLAAHIELHDVDHNPTTQLVRRSNIEKTLYFLKCDGVILHPEAIRGEIDGVGI